jgi:hypothetical protein
LYVYLVRELRRGVAGRLCGGGQTFGRRIDFVQQRLARRIDIGELALERRRGDSGVAALVVPRRGRGQPVEVCGERRYRVVIRSLFGRDAVGVGLPIDAGLFGRDDVIVACDVWLFGRREDVITGDVGKLRVRRVGGLLRVGCRLLRRRNIIAKGVHGDALR